MDPRLQTLAAHIPSATTRRGFGRLNEVFRNLEEAYERTDRHHLVKTLRLAWAAFTRFDWPKLRLLLGVRRAVADGLRNRRHSTETYWITNEIIHNPS